MLETNLDRKLFTKYGQHLNLLVKILTFLKLIAFMKEIFTKQQLSNNCLQWKDSISEGIECKISKTEVRVVLAGVPDQNKLYRISHPSKRQRKIAALRKPECL
jgi:hypothetical protein